MLAFIDLKKFKSVLNECARNDLANIPPSHSFFVIVEELTFLINETLPLKIDFYLVSELVALLELWEGRRNSRRSYTSLYPIQKV